MENSKYIIIGLIAAIIIFIGGLFTGKYKFSTQDIKIVDRVITETKWKTKIEYIKSKPQFTQENFDLFYDSWKSPINFKDKTENNNLFVTAYTDYKEATARYEIGTKNDWKMYLAFAGLGAVATAGTLYYFFR